MTDRSSKSSRQAVGSKTLHAVREGTRVSRQSNADAIADGLQFIFSMQQDHHWTELNGTSHVSDVWVTGYVLSRIGDAPASFFTPKQFQQVDLAAEWIQHARTKQGGWSFCRGATADAASTSWAMIALRHFNRPVPHSVTNWLQSCRRADGGFAAHPQGCSVGCCQTSSAGVTAVVANALGELDSSAEQFLAAHLQQAAPDDAGANVDRSFVCSEILDCEAALAPWSLLNGICRLAMVNIPGSSFETGLLLRSLLRLRMRRARQVSDCLRTLQRSDGSWPGGPIPAAALAGLGSHGEQPPVDRSGLLATATAISALVVAESQPGLYDGSYLPRPRRLPEV